jgi:SpoVK/Ycf46/Vps4 family AAA+-type ATPase
MKDNGFKKFTYVDPGKKEDINLEDLGRFTLNYNNMYKYNTKLVNRNSNIVKKDESPNKTLKSMIGLSQIKETINDIINVITLKKTLIKKKVPLEQPCMHMVFYGNPGTAKTTVARLVAKILKKKGILSTGVFKEVGRQDLVGKYVGWTAPTVEKAIKSARGGILFIDEAYSLCEGKEGLYGDEAINTLIQQMELVKSHTIIILAGYPDEMEKLLDTNPGFRSRIAFHVKFPNYSKEELIDILKLMASKQQFTLSDEYLEEVEKQLPKYMTAKDFGNGRFMRSLLEQSIMKLSSRLTKNNEGKELNDLSIKELTTLTKEDVAFDQLIKSDKTIGIGFNV